MTRRFAWRGILCYNPAVDTAAKGAPWMRRLADRACRTLAGLWIRALRLRHDLAQRGRPWPARRARARFPFIRGVNLPWFSYGNDFGASAWNPGGGIASGRGPERLEEVFSRLAGAGIECVRWFLFGDGRSGIIADPQGKPRGLDERIFADLDLALEAAGRHRLRLIPVLFDFHLCAERKEINGLPLGGRLGWIRDRGGRRALRRRVLKPLLRRYRGRPEILAWDLFNEPEWATFGLGGQESVAAVFPWRMRRFLATSARLVRGLARHPVTVGLASARGLPLVRGIGLDLFQVHWYDRYDALSPLDSPVKRLKLNRPLLLGEYPTRGSARRPDEIEETARRNGYCGALAWSALAGDSASGFGFSEDRGDGAGPD